MKLSKRTLEILNNFVKINDSIIFQKGNEINTKTIQNHIIAKAVVEEEFPVEFGIFNLSEFLQMISLFRDPDLDFQENVCIISEGNRKVIYAACNTDIIKNQPLKNFNPPSWDINFELKVGDTKKLMKAAAVLDQDLIIISPNERGELKAKTSKTDVINTATSNSFDTTIGETDLKDFKIEFPRESLIMLEHDYSVDVSFNGIGQFQTNDLTYWIATKES